MLSELEELAREENVAIEQELGKKYLYRDSSCENIGKVY